MLTTSENGTLPRGNTRNSDWLWATRVIIFVAFLDLFMQFPVIAPYARSLGSPSLMVGIIVATYSATNLIGNFGAGVILDRWGRKQPLLVGLLATAIALLGYAFAKTPQQLLAARAIHGLTVAVLTPGAFAILGDSTNAKQRARAMGLGGAFIAIAAMVGPPIAGVVRDNYGAETVFFLVATIMVGTFLFVWYFGRKGIPISREKQPQDITPVNIPFWRLPRLMASYFTALVLTIGLGTLVTHLPLVMAEKGESATRTGLNFTAFAIVAMIAMASPLNGLSDRFGRLRPMIAGLAIVATGMLVLWASTDFLNNVLGMGIFGLGFGIIFPAMTALVAEGVPGYQRGKAFGVFYAVFSMGVVIGSVVSGFIAEQLGNTNELPYLVSAIAALAAIPAINGIWHFQKGCSGSD
ncbi:MFS transporter [Chloroflexota bacterium]